MIFFLLFGYMSLGCKLHNGEPTSTDACIMLIPDPKQPKWKIGSKVKLQLKDQVTDLSDYAVLRCFNYFSGLVKTVFLCWHGFYLFPVLAQILPLSGTDTDSTIFRYSSGQLFRTRTESTIFRYSPGFYHFQVLTLILPFVGTRRYSFLVLARIPHFPSTRSDSTIFRDWHRFYHISGLVGTVFRYWHGFYLFPIHARSLPFSGTDTDSTIFRYSWDSFSVLARILPFPGTRPDSTFFRYF